MSAPFTPVTTLEQLDELFVESNHTPIVVFNHDPKCPISRMAYASMSSMNTSVAMIDVARANHLAHALEQRTGVTHESPQVVVLHHEQSIWDASHFDVTDDAVKRIVSQAQPKASK